MLAQPMNPQHWHLQVAWRVGSREQRAHVSKSSRTSSIELDTAELPMLALILVMKLRPACTMVSAQLHLSLLHV